MSDFDLNKFIDRGEEIAIVMNRVSDMAKGKPFTPKERVFHFLGPSGIGKSTLLEKIRSLLAQKQGIVPILIRLNMLRDKEQSFIDELLKMVYQRFYEYQKIGANPVLKDPLASSREYAYMILRAISLRDVTPVLLLDEVNIPSQKDMQEIEAHLLVKFIHDNDRTILITAGRSIHPRFDDFALRHTTTNTFLLPVFDEEKTGQQLEYLKPGTGKLAGKVVKMGSGVPGNTVKLVKHLASDSLDFLDEAQAVQSLLDDIKQANHIEARFTPMLEAISILQGFFPEDIAPLFQNHPQLGNDWEESRVKGIFLELSQLQIGPSGLVDWDREKKSWVMDESTRGLIERELQMRNPDLWRKLHCAAVEMYQRWGQEYDSDKYREKATYHQQRLQSVGMNCE